MISIKKNKIINLDIPKFLCDNNSVGEHLNNHPLLKLLNVYGFLCVLGRPGMGKTSLTVSFLTQKKPQIYRKTHHHVIILMPANSIASMSKNPFKQLPDENIYNELNDLIINDIFNKIYGYCANNEKTLLYIDDMTADLKKNKFIIDTIKKLIYNRRNLKLNIIITAQSFSNIPLDIRKNIQNLILFKPPKKEMELIFDEIIENKKELFLKIMKLAFRNKNDFLFINVPSQRIFTNWDELEFDDEDSD
jgi:hypothetical protein